MKYHLIDGNNLIYRFVHTTPYPLKAFMYRVIASKYPVIVWDGMNALKSRREIYPEYKANRNRENKDPITYESMDIARRIAANLDCIQVRVEGFEADDVIAYMVDKLGAENIEKIHTNDIDLTGFGIPTDSTKEIPDHLKLHKTLVGKSSDNVKGLYRFGPKAWEKLNKADKLFIEFWLDEGYKPNHHGLSDEKIEAKIEEDLENLKTMWKISNFLPVPDTAIDAGVVSGSENMQEIEMIRSEFLLWPEV